MLPMGELSNAARVIRCADFPDNFLVVVNDVTNNIMTRVVKRESSAMNASGWGLLFRRRAWAALGVALLFFATAVIVKASEAKSTKRRTANAKPAAKAPAVAANSGAAAKSSAATKSYDIVFNEFKLNNGLRVLLAEDHSAPTFSICMTYNVGSRDERPGRTGFAHLFEHMLFQGSENVGKGEHFILVQNNGGSANGTTNADRTNYFETLPANQLELGIFLEADRMRAPAIKQANFDNQR